MVELLHGDCLDLMRAMEPASVDAIVCDPPYALTASARGSTPGSVAASKDVFARVKAGGFMGQKWDSEIPGAATWALALAAAKPGAHLLAFGGTRTFHRLTCAIEDAGWEIRDCLSWLYGSGFPKSHNGPWGGTALKPGWEPIVMARKPLIGTVEVNHAEHGTGALNIDGCRIETEARPLVQSDRRSGANGTYGDGLGGSRATGDTDLGRWPANVVLDEEAAAMLDEQSGETASRPRIERNSGRADESQYRIKPTPGTIKDFGDTGGASRFFYCAKASRAERDAGLTGEKKPLLWSAGTQNPGSFQSAGTDKSARNNHPTVKPVALMRWLCRLVTPAGGMVLDPFMGSGSTGIAAVLEGFHFTGMEREAEYLAIAERRIAHARSQPSLFEAS